MEKAPKAVAWLERMSAWPALKAALATSRQAPAPAETGPTAKRG
jgi:hypothetical protein